MSSSEPATTSPFGPAPGDRIGRYQVERLVGKGGMGAVYAAHNVNSGRAVALKVIKAGPDQTLDQRRRFLREAKAATAIRHPNVIEILDVFEADDGTLVMVMELLEGETLSDLRERRGALTLRETAEIFLPIAEALAAAHQKGIVHRDLKPENVFLAQRSTGRQPIVLDFGIAKVLDPTTITSETQGQETATGSLLGTPHYMSYEQAMSEKQIDRRTDVWSLGVMLFEVLTGRRPLEFGNLGEMYTAFLTGTIPSIGRYVPDLPADAVAIIDHCLAKARDERLDDLEPLIALLRHYSRAESPGGDAGGRVVSQRPPPAPPASSISAVHTEISAVRVSSRYKGIVAAAVLAVVGAGALVALPGRDTPEPEPAAEPTKAAPAEPTTGEAAPTAEATVPVAPVDEPIAEDPSLKAASSATAAPPVGWTAPVLPLPAPAAEVAPEPPPPPPPSKGLAEVDPY
jgi:eukaryotic-like serine/threonine-protein kinase